MLGHGVADDGGIVGIHHAVAVGIGKFHHAGEGLLSVGQRVGAVILAHADGVVRHAGLQRPHAVGHREVVNRVEAGALHALHQSDGLAFLHHVVVGGHAHGRAPVGVCRGYHLVLQLVHLVLVVVVGQPEAEAPVFLAHDVIVQRQLDASVRGACDVLHLVAEARRGVAGHEHQHVLRGVVVEVEATVQLAVPEAEVETDVARDGGLPLQVGVAQGLAGLVDGDALAVDGG